MKFATGEAEIARQQRNADSVDRSIVKLEVSISVGTGARARNGDGHIEIASQRLSDSGQLRNLRQIGVAQVKVQSKGSALGQYAACQRGTDVEVRRGVAMNEGPIVSGEMIARILDSGGECVPVKNSCGNSFGRRQGRVKVVDFKISANGRRREFAAGVAGKARPAVNGKGQIPGSVGRFDERRPLPQVMAGEREAQG